MMIYLKGKPIIGKTFKLAENTPEAHGFGKSERDKLLDELEKDITQIWELQADMLERVARMEKKLDNLKVKKNHSNGNYVTYYDTLTNK